MSQVSIAYYYIMVVIMSFLCKIVFLQLQIVELRVLQRAFRREDSLWETLSLVYLAMATLHSLVMNTLSIRCITNECCVVIASAIYLLGRSIRAGSSSNIAAWMVSVNFFAT